MCLISLKTHITLRIPSHYLLSYQFVWSTALFFLNSPRSIPLPCLSSSLQKRRGLHKVLAICDMFSLRNLWLWKGYISLSNNNNCPRSWFVENTCIVLFAECEFNHANYLHLICGWIFEKSSIAARFFSAVFRLFLYAMHWFAHTSVISSRQIVFSVGKKFLCKFTLYIMNSS